MFGGSKKSRQDHHGFSAMHLASLGTVSIDDVDNHVAESVEVLSASDGSPVSLIQFSRCLLFLCRIAPAPPEEPNCLSESFLVVDQCGGHGELCGQDCGVELVPFAVAQAVEFLNNMVLLVL